MMKMRVLVVGGYGDVGRRIATGLSGDEGLQIVVAGRNFDKAAALASKFGERGESRQFDIEDRMAVDEAVIDCDLIICCVDQQEPHLVSAAITQRTRYLDITADAGFILRCRAMHQQAEAAGAHVWLGSGFSPGLVNVMARSATAELPDVDAVHSFLVMSLGDEAGPAVLEFMLEAASKSFSVVGNRERRPMWAFRGSREVDLPGKEKRVRAYRFPMPDQFFFPETLGVSTAGSWLAFQPAWINLSLAALSHSRAIRLLRWRMMRQAIAKAVIWAESAFHGRKQVKAIVQASGSAGTVHLTVSGCGQSKATAASALVMARMLRDGPMSPPGVWLPEQVVEPSPYFQSLAELGWSVKRY